MLEHSHSRYRNLYYFYFWCECWKHSHQMLKAFTALIFCVFIIFIIIIIPPLLCRSISSTYFNLHTSSIYQHFQLFKGFLGPVQHFQKNSYISYFFNVLWKIFKYSNPIQIHGHDAKRYSSLILHPRNLIQTDKYSADFLLSLFNTKFSTNV